VVEGNNREVRLNSLIYVRWIANRVTAVACYTDSQPSQILGGSYVGSVQGKSMQ